MENRRIQLKGGETGEHPAPIQGTLIAFTAYTATLMDAGVLVYFEIRHGSTPLDPLLWLDKTGLILP